ncbi:MAG TPA: carboxypeptidase-like regulatory domain-containing protein [Planctomycetota bacterium]|nr:carboxypeptidase-like regulatory domain-containing protein [Planctomycetota bacterium]
MQLSRLLVLLSFGGLAAQAEPLANGSGSLRVRVVDPHGGPVSCFAVALRCCVGPQQYAVVPDVPVRHFEPRDLLGDAMVLTRLPVGRFALRIDSLGFARTMSPPFTIEDGVRSEVVVRLTRGGFVRGQVVDADGKPVANASVRTVDDMEARGVPRVIREALANRQPDLTTRASTRSDADGRFELDQLAIGTYALRIHHDDFADRIVRDVRVAVTVPALLDACRLVSGAIVEGSCAALGSGRFYVSVSSKAPDGALAFWAETGTDKAGRFRLPERVPPGDYTIAFAPVSEQEAVFAFHSLSIDQPLRVAKDQQTVTIEARKR